MDSKGKKLRGGDGVADMGVVKLPFWDVHCAAD